MVARRARLQNEDAGVLTTGTVIIKGRRKRPSQLGSKTVWVVFCESRLMKLIDHSCHIRIRLVLVAGPSGHSVASVEFPAH